MWPITLSGRLPIVGLVGRYLTNYLIGREPTPNRIAPLTPWPCGPVVACGIRTPFGILSPCLGQVAHALLTRPPLKHTTFHPKTSACMSPLDLHVLGTPPAFVLSQDQTLPFNPSSNLPLSLKIFTHQNHLSLCVSSFCIFVKVRICSPAVNSVRSELDYHTKGYAICQPLFSHFLFIFSQSCLEMCLRLTSVILQPYLSESALICRADAKNCLMKSKGGCIIERGDTSSTQNGGGNLSAAQSARIPQGNAVGHSRRIPCRSSAFLPYNRAGALQPPC